MCLCHSWCWKRELINDIFIFFSTVSAEILKSSLTTMERHIVRLENDIENFPKSDDPQDKFVEKMSISFFCCLYSVRSYRDARRVEYEVTLCIEAAKACCVCVLAGKHLKSLGVIGGTPGTVREWIWLPCCEMLIGSPSSLLPQFPRVKSCLQLFLLQSAMAGCPPGGLFNGGSRPSHQLIYLPSLISSSDPAA